MPSPDMYRTFIAIELPADLREQIASYIDGLRKQFPNVSASWVRPENLHLTLKFLGDVSVKRIPALAKAVERTADWSRRFEIQVSGCGVFPTRGRPKVLWLGTEDRERGLYELHQRLEDECFRSDFPRDERSFHPHLTIARIRKPEAARELGAAHQSSGFRSQEFSVQEVVVFRSELSREGAKHTVVSRHTLREQQ